MNNPLFAEARYDVRPHLLKEATAPTTVEVTTLEELRRYVPDLASEASTIFGTPLWMQTTARNKAAGGAFRMKAVLARTGGDPSGFLIGWELSMPGFRAFLSPLPRTLSQYGGLTVLPGYSQARQRIADGMLRAVYENYDLGFVITPPGVAFAPGRPHPDWTVVPRVSLVVDLSKDKDQIWSNVSKPARNRVRHAVGAGVGVDFVEGARALPDFLELLGGVSTERHWGLPFGGAFFGDLLATFKGSSLIARASCGGACVAGALLLYDKKTVYCHSFAATPEGRKLGAPNLLHWSIINWAKGRGLSTYDLLGANIPRIARFKRNMGGTDVRYSMIVFSRHQSLARLERWALGFATSRALS